MKNLLISSRAGWHGVRQARLRGALMLGLVAMSVGCAKCSRSPDSRSDASSAHASLQGTRLDQILGYNSGECIPCARANCQSSMARCMEVEGIASAGPSKGTLRAQLCAETLSCAIKARCVDDQTTMHCYCGSARGLDCVRSKANGSCKAALESGLETTDPGEISTSFGNERTGGGAAMTLAQCLVDHGCSRCF